LAAGAAIAAVGLAGCGGDGDDEGDADTASTGAAATAAAEDGQRILIKLRYARLPDGEVLAGSAIGGSPFCQGGTTHDEHGPAYGPLVVSTFDCPSGTLEIGFSPTQPKLKQTSSWQVTDGSGDYEGLTGGGDMTAVFDKKGSGGRATFTGTVSQ